MVLVRAPPVVQCCPQRRAPGGWSGAPSPPACGSGPVVPSAQGVRSTWSCTSPDLAAGPNDLDELGHLVVDLAALLHEGADLLDGVDHRGVVPPAVLPGDGRVAEVGQLPAHVHADLAGGDERAPAALALELLHREA